MIYLKSEFSYFNLYFEDESRFGLMTRNGRSLTAKGIKPVCSFLQAFENLWLFGAFSPVNGEYFLLELPNCDSEHFQIWLNEFSEMTLSKVNKRSLNSCYQIVT